MNCTNCSIPTKFPKFLNCLHPYCTRCFIHLTPTRCPACPRSYHKNPSSQEYLYNRKSLYQNLQCSICDELLKLPKTLDCSHSFCSECITKWRNIKNKCPLCRSSINRKIYLFKVDFQKQSEVNSLRSEFGEDVSLELLDEVIKSEESGISLKVEKSETRGFLKDVKVKEKCQPILEGKEIFQQYKSTSDFEEFVQGIIVRIFVLVFLIGFFISVLR